MLEIAGLIVSGVGLLKDLFNLHKDLSSWNNEELEVDRDWLPLALDKGVLEGDASDYAWLSVAKVPTRELQGTHEVVVAHNEERKVLYRIVRGQLPDRIILTKKL